ncbi:MAG TPA: hypothetical protein VGQ17_12790 [Gemmatimonadales bacterium]|jgi:hypothetical protein|nr:hypothetical protein [Gemmatimonadales bacterium]
MARPFAAIALVVAIPCAPLPAQQHAIWVDASGGVKSGAQRVALSGWYRVVHLAGRLELGLGARATAYAGEPVGYINRESVGGNFASTVLIDPAVYALDAGVFGELKLIGPVAVGANLDVLGVATGPRRRTGPLEAKPEAGSYFAYSSSDHGALNSEFYVSWRIVPRVRLRGGMSHYVTDYTVTDAAAAGSPSRRYQKFQTVPFLAIGLQL